MKTGRTAAQSHLRGSGQWKPAELDGVSKRICELLHFTGVWLFATKWTASRKAPLSMGFSRQEYWSVLPCPPTGIFPAQGWNPHFLWLPHCRWILYRQATGRSPSWRPLFKNIHWEPTMYWGGPKVCLGFSVTSYEKPKWTFWPTQRKVRG